MHGVLALLDGPVDTQGKQELHGVGQDGIEHTCLQVEDREAVLDDGYGRVDGDVVS